MPKVGDKCSLCVTSAQRGALGRDEIRRLVLHNEALVCPRCDRLPDAMTAGRYAGAA